MKSLKINLTHNDKEWSLEQTSNEIKDLTEINSCSYFPEDKAMINEIIITLTNLLSVIDNEGELNVKFKDREITLHIQEK